MSKERLATTILFAVTILLLGLGAPAAASEGAALRGQAVSAGEPVAGARVTLRPMVGHWRLGAQFLGLAAPPAAEEETETDAEGRFEVVAPAAGFWSVRLEAERSARRGATQRLAPLERLLLDVVDDRELGSLELLPAEALEIAVTDAEGRPLEARLSVFRTANARRGADMMLLGHRWRVASSSEDGTPIRMLLTDAQGRLEIDVAAGDRLLVRAVAPGFVAREAPAHGGGKVRLALRRGVERPLRVLAVDRRPLAGVLVYDERAEVPLTATGEDGKAVVAWEGNGALRVALLDAEGRRATLAIEVPGRGDQKENPPIEEMVVVLEEPAILTGRLIDRFTREPIAGALVWSGDLGNHARSGPAGDYELLRLGRHVGFTALAIGYLKRWARADDYDLPAPTLPMHPTVTLSGRAVDREESPIAGVEIEVRQDFGRREAAAKHSGWRGGSVLGRSAGDGGFRLAGLPARMAFVLSAEREGWASAEMEIESVEPFAHREGLHLVLESGRCALGTVVDESEEPVAGATVTLSARSELEGRDPRRGDRRRRPQGTTDGEGRFRVADLAAGRHDLEITSPDHATARTLGVEILDSETDLGVFRLEPGAVFEGRIIDLEARPVAGAEIRFSNDPALPVSRARRALAGEPAAAVSDAEGRFELTGQRPGASLTLVVESVDHLPEVASGLEAPSAAPVEIVLRPPSRVAGRVLDPAGLGVPEAKLMLVSEGRAGSGGYGGSPLYADSRDDGSFAIHQVPAGRITLLSFAPGLQDLRRSGLEVPEGGELIGVELAMKACSTLLGMVQGPEGEPVAGALVQLLNYRGGRKRWLSDGDGRYQLDGLAATTVSVAADHDDFPRALRELELEPGRNQADLVFGGGVAVSGHVRDALGEPVAGAWVRLVRAVRSRHSPATVAGEDGAFLFPGVARGDYFVDAGRRGFAQTRLEPPIRVRESAVAGLELELGRGAALGGSILGLEGEELARVGVAAYGQSGVRRGEVDADARYRVEHLAAGDWTVRAAVEPGGRSVVETVKIEDDQEEASLDLDFASGFTLRGTVTHDGAALSGARVGARGLSVSYVSDATTDLEGRFRLDGLEQGRYWLGLYDYATGLRHSEEIDLDGDHDLQVDLITDRVAGVATNALDLEPVEDVRVVLEPILEDQEIAARLLQPTGLSDSGGAFSLGEVAHGRYRLVAARAGYAELTSELDVDGALEDLELELTPTEGVFFELTLADAGPVDWATAVILDGERVVARGAWESSENGRLRITGVRPGSYQMLIAAPGSATREVSVTSPGDLGRIVLPRAGRADVAVPELAGDGTVAVVRFLGAGGRPYRSVIRARVEDEFRLREGKALIPGLPAGAWTVRVEAADGRSWTASATIEVDRVTSVTLDSP